MVANNSEISGVKKRKFDAAALVAAVIIAFASCIGTLYADPNRSGSSLGVLIRSCLLETIILAIAVYIILFLLFQHFDSNHIQEFKHTDFTNIDLKFLIKVFCILLVSWMIWIIPHWPGTMRDDSIPQMLQAMGYYQFYTQHPIFDTLWFGLFWKLGAFLGDLKIGLFIYVVVQAILSALVFSFIVSYLRMTGVSNGLIALAIVFYAFSRSVYQPIDTMSKDAFNGYIFALVVLLQVDIVRCNGAWLNRCGCVFLYICLLFFCIASKRTMLYVLIPSALLISLYLYFNKAAGAKLAFISLVPTLLFLLIWNPISILITDASSNATYEMLSIPEQEVTACISANPSILSQEEYEDLNQYYDYRCAIEVYNPSRSDEVSGVVRENPNKAALFKTWIKVLVRDPKECVKSFLSMSGKWFSLTSTIDYGHDMEEELLNPVRIQAWSSFFGDDVEKTESILGELRGGDNSKSGITKRLEDLDNAQRALAPLCSYGLFAFAIPVSVAIYALSRRLKTVVILSVIPALVLLSYLVGPIALYWYSIPSVYIAPLVLFLPLILDGLKMEECRS